jgi:emp24/gp25L/p24 family/GOLD
MRSLLPLLLSALSILSLTSATALTYRLAGNEKSCFFTETHRRDAKVAFYFAVQSGGSFDIDYSVHGPNDKQIMAGEKERQGDFVFTAQEMGEYRFCFSNEGYTASEKDVDFEIAVEVRIPRDCEVRGRLLMFT